MPSRGRVPKWCSTTCRHRAWEQKRAAESGRSAVEVVDRPVEIVRVEKQVRERRVTQEVLRSPRTAAEWRGQLQDAEWFLRSFRCTEEDLDVLEPLIVDLYRAARARRELLADLRRPAAAPPPPSPRGSVFGVPPHGS